MPGLCLRNLKKKEKKKVGFSEDNPITHCAPLVRVPGVVGGSAVWRHNKPKTKKPQEGKKEKIPHSIKQPKTHTNSMNHNVCLKKYS